jgi:hypothetical protein
MLAFIISFAIPSAKRTFQVYSLVNIGAHSYGNTGVQTTEINIHWLKCFFVNA